jgi:GT2 family glycosyltransferase
MDVSIIIVNYNTKDLLKKCLNSIINQTSNISYEIIVSDNGSQDGSIDMIKDEFPSVILVENNANLGFGTANNKGLSIAKGKYIFYLNSDTILLNNAIKIFFDYYETHSHDDIGCIGANLLDKDHSVIHSYDSFPSILAEIKGLFRAPFYLTKLFVTYILPRRTLPQYIDNQHQSFFIGEVDRIAGADIFMLNDMNAYFDDHIFLYFEDTELQFKLHQMKKHNYLIEGPEIVHLIGGSAIKKLNVLDKMRSFTNIQYNLSRVYYFKKHHSNYVLYILLKYLTIFYFIQPLMIKYTYPSLKKLIRM